MKTPTQQVAESLVRQLEEMDIQNSGDRTLTIKAYTVIQDSIGEAFEEGKKHMMQAANNLTEKTDRAVRYVPLDKLYEYYHDR